MGSVLIIVESPAKARTLKRFLGSGYEIESSIGHIRDLPSSASEIPKRHKEQPWARLGVDINSEFTPLYVVPQAKKAQVRKLKDKLKGAAALYLATDGDREGEAIAWHLIEVLKPKIPVRRMVFHEITKNAVQNALSETREIDDRLVSAQEARRILDRLVGYEVSPILWKKVKTGLSAGRVQSVATRLVVAREESRMRFVEAAFASLSANLSLDGGDQFAARLIELNGRRVAVGKDFDPETGKLRGRAEVLSAESADRLVEHLQQEMFTVADVAEKPFVSRPYPPFMTSTLQQEAARKLRFNAQRTMRLAQGLYENGYITYMRTDSPTLSGEALTAARNQVKDLYGSKYLPEKTRVFSSKSKNAQEAHEAIRPAGATFRTPQSLREALDTDQWRLYELIWKRTLASQMRDAHGRRTSVRVEADAGDDGTAVFNATGKVIDFAGFLRAYVEGSDDPRAELADQEKILPHLSSGDRLQQTGLESSRRTTQPQARYTEASLVKELESRGIGRPSTYATIIQTIQDRGYVWHKGPALVPTFTAFAVVKLLERHLPDLVDYDFTAKMEDELDTIARGERELAPSLRDFYFGGAGNGRRIVKIGLHQLVESSKESIEARTASRIVIGKAEDGTEIAVRIGRYGPYLQLGDTEKRAAVPEDVAPDELTVTRALELLEQSQNGARILGEDPETGKSVFLKSGRFGPYVQLGEPERTEKGTLKKGGKPKMASLWKDMNPDEATLEQALMLLSFPREVGQHPSSGEVITAQDGRFGPYLKMGEETRSLERQEMLATVTLEQAVELLAQPKGRQRTRRSGVIAELGAHPQYGDTIQVKDGRFGPYVTDGTVNATVPKGTDPATVTLERALDLLAAREDKLRAQGKDPRAPKAKGKKKTATTRRKKKS